MSSALRTGCLLILLGLAPCVAVSGENGATATVQTEQFDGWTRTTVTVPGKLVSYALPRSADGTRGLALLVNPKAQPPKVEDALGDDEEDDDAPERLPVCPEKDTRSDLILLRLPPGADAQPVTVREGLSHELQALDTADLDGDGSDELLLARGDELLVVDTTDERRVVQDAGLVWSSLHPRATEQPELDGRPLVPTMPLGELLLFGANDTDGEWGRLAAVEIPVKGNVRKHSLTLFNPVPRFVGTREDGTLLFTTRPEPFDKQRLQILLIAISPSGEAEVTDCWVRLPGREDVIEESFLIIDGRAMLLVMTKPADKLSLFGEKRLRLFPLVLDRSRLGRPPVFVAESRINMWQETAPLLLDVNGDGRRDLVIGYWKGLKDDRVVLDVYLREAEGWFAASPKSTAFDVDPAKRRKSPEDKPRRPSPDRTFMKYGSDVDGDGLPDLLLRTPAGLLVFRGRASGDGEKLVEREPLEIPFVTDAEIGVQYVDFQLDDFEIWTTGDPGSPRLADLDNDGAAEILTVTRESGRDRDLLQVVRLSP